MNPSIISVYEEINSSSVSIRSVKIMRILSKKNSCSSNVIGQVGSLSAATKNIKYDGMIWETLRSKLQMNKSRT
jgi:hypothetical protein